MESSQIKVACILILCFLTNFFITKPRLGISNVEILCEEHAKLLTFSRL